MFGRYALPSDDLAPSATGVTTSGAGSPVVSDEDPDYLAENIISANPSRPAKLTSTSGYFQLTFGSAITVRAAAIIYHNLDAGLNVTLVGGSGSPSFSTAITIPAARPDGWTVSPWVEFVSPQTYNTWKLSINAANSLDVMVGRLLLIGTLREMDTDVRWGVVEEEEHQIIEQTTELGVETIYNLEGPRRSFSGEFAFENDSAAELITLHRSARNRVLPWLLIPDEAVNDAWLVRFQESRWSRTREMPNHNIFPYRVNELSRGLPWP